MKTAQAVTNRFAVSQVSVPINTGKYARFFNADRRLEPRVAPDCAFIPTVNRIVVRRAPLTEVSAGGIHIPEVARENYSGGSAWTGERAASDLHGEVVAIGPGKPYTNGRVAVDLELGDIAYFGPHANDAEVDGERDLILMHDDDVLFAVRDGALVVVMDRVLIRRAESKILSGLILIPDQSVEHPNEGVVLAAGRGTRLDSGTLVPMDVKPGDRVLFPVSSGIDVRYGGAEMLVMREQDILGVVE